MHIKQYCLFLTGAVKEIQTRIPEGVELYCLESTATVVRAAVNLDKKLEDSSPGMPAVNHSKSMAGNERAQR